MMQHPILFVLENHMKLYDNLYELYQDNLYELYEDIINLVWLIFNDHHFITINFEVYTNLLSISLVYTIGLYWGQSSPQRGFITTLVSVLSLKYCKVSDSGVAPATGPKYSELKFDAWWMFYNLYKEELPYWVYIRVFIFL